MGIQQVYLWVYLNQVIMATDGGLKHGGLVVVDKKKWKGFWV